MRIEKTVAASELSPCPFCGGYALFDIRDRKGFVFCNKCKARTNEFFDPFLPLRLVALLIEAWNTRAEKKLID